MLASFACRVVVIPHRKADMVYNRLKCFSHIRYHHLIKTFFTGPGGWRDHQFPDGTVVLIS
ncbi:hypothetical protein ABQF26_09405, partial [Mycolicibacterium elephantis]